MKSMAERGVPHYENVRLKALTLWGLSLNSRLPKLAGKLQLIQSPPKYENSTFVQPKSFRLSRALCNCGHAAIRRSHNGVCCSEFIRPIMGEIR
jgi:hypothetical protein